MVGMIVGVSISGGERLVNCMFMVMNRLDISLVIKFMIKLWV